MTEGPLSTRHFVRATNDPSTGFAGPPPRSGEEFGPAATRLAGIAGALLGWRPDAFWAATPAELGCILTALLPEGAAPPSPTDIDALKERFPDG